MMEYWWSRISSHLGICQGVIWQDHLVDRFSAFLGLSILISRVARHVRHVGNFTNSEWWFPFPASFPVFVISVLTFAILIASRWNFKVGLIYISRIIWDAEHFSQHLLVIFIFSFEGTLQIASLFIEWVIVFYFNSDFFEVLVCLNINPLSKV